MSLGRFLLFALTAVAFLLTAVSVLKEPPPLWVPLAFVVVYLSVIGVGVMNLQLQMFGDAICRVDGARGRVALTFDDGPDPVTTREALAILKEAGALATFFVVGRKAEKYPEVLRDIVEAGHALGIHSYAHDRLYAFLPPEAVRRDIERTRQIIFEATGKSPIWFRPPVGQMSPRTAAGVERAGVTVVGWSVRARDGLRRTSPEQCSRRIRKQLKEGAIVLMHDAWEYEEAASGAEGSPLLACPAGVRALRDVLDECARRGLRAVTVDELLETSDGG